MEVKSTIEEKNTLQSDRELILNTLIVANSYTEKLNNFFRLYELSMEQFNVLRILKGQIGNEVSMQDVQQRMITKSSNTTRLVDKLVEKKLVERRHCSDNRRKVLVKITSTGTDLLGAMDPGFVQLEKEITSVFSENEKKELIRLLNKNNCNNK